VPTVADDSAAIGYPGGRNRLIHHVRAMFDFDTHEKRVLAPLILAGFFENYDNTLLALAGPTIAAGLTDGDVAKLGAGIAVLRFGALLSLPLLRLADRWGRRRVLLLSLVAFTVATGLTAAAWALAAFVAFQFTARCFLQVEGSLAGIVITEEVRPDRRGAGLSLLGMVSGLGAGGLILMKIVVDQVPGTQGWRLFYLFALLPLAIVAWLRRNFKETRAFTAAKESQRVQHSFWPQVERRHIPLLVRAVAVTSVYGLLLVPGFFWASQLAEDEYGWKGVYIAILLAGAAFGFLGFFLGGRLSDVFGRRRITALSLVLLGVGFVAVFSEVRYLFPIGFWLAVTGLSSFQAVSQALLSELFPTEVRASLTSFALMCQVLAGSVGLWVVSGLQAVTGPYVAMSGLALLSGVGAVAALTLPETAGTDVVGEADGAGDAHAAGGVAGIDQLPGEPGEAEPLSETEEGR